MHRHSHPIIPKWHYPLWGNRWRSQQVSTYLRSCLSTSIFTMKNNKPKISWYIILYTIYIYTHYIHSFFSIFVPSFLPTKLSKLQQSGKPQTNLAKIASYCLGSMDLPTAQLHQVDATDSSRSIATEIDSAPVDIMA